MLALVKVECFGTFSFSEALVHTSSAHNMFSCLLNTDLHKRVRAIQKLQAFHELGHLRGICRLDSDLGNGRRLLMKFPKIDISRSKSYGDPLFMFPIILKAIGIQ